jgi:hypothetical protein
MTARQWFGAVVVWLILVATLLRAADGEPAVLGSAAALGVVLLVANARGLARRRPAPFNEGASARAEILLGASLVALAIVSAFDHLVLFLLLLAVAVISAGWVVMSISKSRAQRPEIP